MAAEQLVLSLDAPPQMPAAMPSATLHLLPGAGRAQELAAIAAFVASRGVVKERKHPVDEAICVLRRRGHVVLGNAERGWTIDHRRCTTQELLGLAGIQKRSEEQQQREVLVEVATLPEALEAMRICQIRYKRVAPSYYVVDGRRLHVMKFVAYAADCFRRHNQERAPTQQFASGE